ncbi:MAG: T9SS type A sorting domain-containing protein [Crocinitomicaceae bacterium]
MKRTILLTFAVMIAAASFGQISITVNGNPHVSGTPYIVTTAGAGESLNATIMSNSPVNLTVQRIITNPMPTWEDDLCWGITGGLGQCYFGIEDTNPFVSPDAYLIDQQNNGDFIAKITANDPDYGCSDYKYYFLQNGSVLLDSIEISVCKTASVEDVEPALAVSVSPNPATSYFKVTVNNAADASVQVVDVLGNVVLKETVMGNSKTINTSNFRNGIYFVKVTANKQRPVIRKIIVKH